MPTYEYECQECGQKFELFQSMKAEPCKECPTCKGLVKRCIGMGAGILFKGSGFYETDYRSSGYRKDAGKDTAPKASSTADGAAKSKGKAAESGPAKPA